MSYTRLAAPVLLVSLLVPSAFAHMNSFSYAEIEVGAEKIDYELRVDVLTLVELFQMDRNGDWVIDDDEVTQTWQMLFYYLKNKIKVLCGGRQLPLDLRSVKYSKEPQPHVRINMRFTCPTSDEECVMFCNVSEETDPFHRSISLVKIGDEEYQFVFTNQNYLTVPAAMREAAASGTVSSATEQEEGN